MKKPNKIHMLVVRCRELAHAEYELRLARERVRRAKAAVREVRR